MVFYNIPDAYERRSEEFRVTCGEREVTVLSCRVSAIPFNRPWPGYQRDKAQTALSSYLRLGSDGAFTLVITPKEPFGKVTVRPLSKQIVPEKLADGRVRVTFPGRGQYSVEFDGAHRVLHVFADPETPPDVNEGDENVTYFGPGVHDLHGLYALNDGETVYIDKDAVLFGGFIADHVKNVRIMGYGILDNSLLECGNLPLRATACENIRVEGITIVDSSNWALCFFGGKHIRVDGVKLIGFWRYNADGCDFCNVTDARLANSFIRSFDDCVVVKGLKKCETEAAQDIAVENCVLWCDWGRAVEIGAETAAPAIRHIRFQNIDIIHGMDVMLDIQHGDRAEVEDILYENIRCEYTEKGQKPMLQKEDASVYGNLDPWHMPDLVSLNIVKSAYSHDAAVGNIRNVTFRGLFVFDEASRVPHSHIGSYVDGSIIENVVFDSIFMNGKPVTDPASMRLGMGPGCTEIGFVVIETEQKRSVHDEKQMG